jgi:hypothetical protein
MTLVVGRRDAQPTNKKIVKDDGERCDGKEMQG